MAHRSIVIAEWIEKQNMPCVDSLNVKEIHTKLNTKTVDYEVMSHIEAHSGNKYNRYEYRE